MRAPRPFLRTLATTLVALAAVALLPAQQRSVPNVLILTSYPPANEWTSEQIRGISSVLNGADSDVAIRVETLDSIRHWSDESLAAIVDNLRIQFERNPPALVISTDDEALEFLLTRRAELFGEAPVVFAGVDRDELIARVERRYFTGVHEVFSPLPFLDMVSRLFPDRKTLIFVGDASLASRGIRAPFMEAARERAGYTVELLDGGRQTLEDILGRLRRAPDDSLVITTHFHRDAGANLFEDMDAIRQITSASRVPVLSPALSDMNSGLVAGSANLGFLHGRLTGELAARILKGEKPQDVPVTRDESIRFLFDHRQLRRWSIPLSAMPPDSQILNREISVYDQYLPYAWVVLAFIGVQGAIIVALLLSIRQRKSAAAQIRAQAGELTQINRELERANQSLLLEAGERRRTERELAESQQRLRIAASAAKAGIWEYNLVTGEVYRDATLKRILGYAPEELPDRSVNQNQHLHPDDIELVHSKFRELIAKGGTVDLQHRVVTAQGRIRWVHVAATLVPNASGAPELIVGTSIEITDRIRTEEQLRLTAQRLELALRAARTGVWTWTAADQQIELDPAACRILGLPSEDRFISRDRFMEMVHPEDMSLLRSSALAAMNAGREWDVEFRCRRPDGAWIHASARGAAERPSGESLRIAGVILDVTAQRAAQAEQESVQEELRQRQKLEALGVLAGGVAHDFNNVLTSILGFTILAQERTGEDRETSSFLAEVVRAAHRARDTVQQLLAFSRSPAERDQSKAVNLCAIVKEAVGLLRAPIPASIDIRVCVDPVGLWVQGNASQLHQVVINLGTNAYQAIGSSSGRLEVTVERRRVPKAEALKAGIPPGDRVVLTVSDTGQGITPELVPRVFEPFFTTKEVGKGTGLGLAMVHGIVRSHGAGITVESELGVGTTFRVYFREVAPGDPSLDEQTRERGTGEGALLLVDDEPGIVQLGEITLADGGYTVQGFTDPREALETYRKDPRRYEAVITDLTMPHLTGYDLVKEMRKVRADLPCLLITGYSEPLPPDDKDLQGVLVVKKPFVPHALTAAVASLLRDRSANPV